MQRLQPSTSFQICMSGNLAAVSWLMLFTQMLQADKQWPLTVNVLPDLHLRQVEGSPNDSGAQVAAPPPKSRNGPCSEADDLVGILTGWVVGMLQVLCTHEGDSGDTCICQLATAGHYQDTQGWSKLYLRQPMAASVYSFEHSLQPSNLCSVPLCRLQTGTGTTAQGQAPLRQPVLQTTMGH